MSYLDVEEIARSDTDQVPRPEIVKERPALCAGPVRHDGHVAPMRSIGQSARFYNCSKARGGAQAVAFATFSGTVFESQ